MIFMSLTHTHTRVHTHTCAHTHAVRLVNELSAVAGLDSDRRKSIALLALAVSKREVSFRKQSR